MGKNINRDYIIELVCRFDVPFCGNKFELVSQQREIFFYKHDRNQTLYILIHDWDETLSLRMGLLYPLQYKRIDEYEPVLIGTEGQDTIFKIELNPEVLKTVGTFKYQLFAQDKSTGKILSSDVGKLKIKDCL